MVEKGSDGSSIALCYNFINFWSFSTFFKSEPFSVKELNFSRLPVSLPEN